MAGRGVAPPERPDREEYEDREQCARDDRTGDD